MNLTKIKIQNYKRIGSEPVVFEIKKGLNLIRSEVNGTGKTTLLSAITFLLWGKNGDTKGNTKTTLSTNELVNDINKKDLLVEGYFDNGYIIRRGLKPSIFEIIDETGNNLADRSSKTIDQDFLENELLGYNYDTFMSTIFLNSKPNSIPFIYMSNTQRKEYIEKVLDLRVIHYLNESLKTKISNNKNEISDCSKSIELYKENLQVLSTELNNQKLAQEKQRIEIQQFETNRENLIRDNLNNINLIREKIAELEEKNTKLRETISEGTLSKQIYDKIKIVQDEINLIESIDSNEEINILNSYKQDIQNNISELQSKLISNEDSLKDMQNQLNILLDELKEKDEGTLRDNIKIIDSRLHELQNELTKKETEKNIHFKNKDNYVHCGDCPTLSKIIGVFSVEDYDNYVENSSKVRSQLLHKKAELEEVINSLSTTKTDIDSKRTQISDLTNLINTIKNYIMTKESELNTIDFKIREIDLNKQQKIQELQNQILNLKKDIETLNDKLQTALENNTKEIEDKLNNIISIENNIESIKLQQAPKLIEINEKPLEDCRSKINELQNKYDLLNNQKVELDNLKDSINDKNIKEQALKSYIPIFEEKVNTLISRFTEDDMFTVKAKLTDDFDIVFTKNGKSLNMFSLSEGQKASITFAFTFAFQFLLDTKNQIKESTLFIDEILDIALSSGRLNAIVEYLKEVSSNKSVYIISHNSNIQLELFDNIIDVSIEGGFSKYSFSKGDE